MNQKFTQQELKRAYQLVTADLFTSLKKMKNGQSLRLSPLGTFQKKQVKIKSALDGNTYLYYRISFRLSSTLKKELDK